MTGSAQRSKSETQERSEEQGTSLKNYTCYGFIISVSPRNGIFSICLYLCQSVNQPYGRLKGKVTKTSQSTGMRDTLYNFPFTICAHLFCQPFMYRDACVQLFAALPTDCWKHDQIVVPLSVFSIDSLIFLQNNGTTDGYLSQLVLGILSCWIFPPTASYW